MGIESRMDGFKKVGSKEYVEDVQERMKDFEEVDRHKGHEIEYKQSTLPFGLKKYKNCPHCGEFMEIEAIETKEVIYRCKHCKAQVVQEIDKII